MGLRTGVGFAIIFAALATIVWARGSWITYDGDRNGLRLLGYGAASLCLVGLSGLFWWLALPF